MPLHVIKVSRSFNGIVYDPQACLVERSSDPTHVLFVLDESLGDVGFSKPDLPAWDNRPPEGTFISAQILGSGKGLLIEDRHNATSTSGYWGYLMNWASIDASIIDQDRGKHPVIINR